MMNEEVRKQYIEADRKYVCRTTPFPKEMVGAESEGCYISILSMAASTSISGGDRSLQCRPSQSRSGRSCQGATRQIDAHHGIRQVCDPHPGGCRSSPG